MGSGVRRSTRGRQFAGRGRFAPASRGGWREARTDVWRCMGVDAKPIWPVPRLSTTRRGPGRVQRQVHVQPDGPAGRFMRDTENSHPSDVPELLPPGGPMAVHGIATGPRDLARPSPLTRFRADVLAGLLAPVKTLPCKYLYDDRGSRLFDQICELPEYY